MKLILLNVLILLSLATVFSGLLQTNANAEIIDTAYNDFIINLKKEHDLNQWILKLQMMESGKNEDIIILDTNNKFSYGCLQFQENTFKNYVRKYDLFPQTEDKELLNIIMDCNIQKDLAKRMIRENYENWNHWYNSVNGYGNVVGIGKPPKLF